MCSSDLAIGRSAAILGEAAELIEVLGRQDAEQVVTEDGIDLPGLRALGEARARNVLRVYCRVRDIPSPGHARLLEIWRQIRDPRRDSRICIEWNGYALMRYRSKIHIEKAPGDALQDFEPVAWDGETCLPLLPLGGELSFRPEEGRGLSVDRLRSAPVLVRLRSGGERLQMEANRPRRTLKNLWQERGMPPWRRDRHPLLYCGEELVSVPGLGEDHRWRARPGERGVIVSWRPYELRENVSG